MNERIKELQFQAAAQIPPLLEASEWQREFTKKFAELIVDEMYDFMCKATDNDGAWPSSKEVKQHFGVEE